MKTGKAISYCLNQEAYLRVFLTDGSVPVTNNAAEQSIRPFTQGRKNWYLIDTVGRAKSSAIAYSIAETAKANHLKPYEYFKYILEELPKHGEFEDPSYLEELLLCPEKLPERCRKKLQPDFWLYLFTMPPIGAVFFLASTRYESLTFKYTIGLSSFYSYKPEFIKQEIWAKLLAYNTTELLINHTVIETRGGTKHAYTVDFSAAAHICRIFLHLNSGKNSSNTMLLLKRKLIPIRKDRSFERLHTAHFRRPKYFQYRAA